jgi:hypothetical protein
MWFKDADSFKKYSGHEIDGVWYPRVTKIVDIKSKPALYRYYAEAANFSEASSQSQKSAEEGTKIHEAAEKMLVGEKSKADPAIAPALNAFREFLDSRRIQVVPEHVERRIIHPEERYAGTIDALATIDGKFGVLDIKTSQAIYRDYNLQTAAYLAALGREFSSLSTRWILRIDQAQSCLKCGATLRTKGGREKIRAVNGRTSCSDGEHEWQEVLGQIELKEFPYWRDDFDAFLAAKRLWEWENDYWLRQIGYLK